jgi:hypothetical protein
MKKFLDFLVAKETEPEYKSDSKTQGGGREECCETVSPFFITSEEVPTCNTDVLSVCKNSPVVASLTVRCEKGYVLVIF